MNVAMELLWTNVIERKERARWWRRRTSVACQSRAGESEALGYLTCRTYRKKTDVMHDNVQSVYSSLVLE